MAKLSEILGDSYNTLSEEVRNQYKDIDLVDSSKYVKKELFDTKETELNTTKTQLKEANTAIQSYKDMDIESIKKSADNWKNKYETDTKDLNDKLKKQQYEFAAKDFLGNYDFLSERVKNSILKEFMDKDFKLEDGKFLGAEDWVKNLNESEPELFKAKSNDPKVVFTNKTKIDTKDTKMSLADMMKAKNENPEMEISFNK